ncbi:MAG TPA: hypothetical protein VG755_29765 [Nannocystaceae bacterium]|nr:hypothetical protein [Nannocystaceae bacterium]
MTERPTSADLETWRVADLSDGFADRVLARLYELDERERVEPTRALPRPRRTGGVAIACAAVAAALLLLWLLRPAPPVVVELRALEIAFPSALEEPGLTRASIRRTLHEQLVPGIELCYEGLQLNDIDAQGQIILELEVVRRGDRGVVARAAFDPISELEQPLFRNCVMDYVNLLAFDPPVGDDPVEIELPFELRRE